MPEEEAFAVLVQIMQQHRMRDMFKPSMAELGIEFVYLFCIQYTIIELIIIKSRCEIYRFMHVSIGKSCARAIT